MTIVAEAFAYQGVVWRVKLIMAADEAKNDLKSFHQFVREQLETGVQLATDQVLAMWRQRLETLEGLEAVDADRT